MSIARLAIRTLRLHSATYHAHNEPGMVLYDGGDDPAHRSGHVALPRSRGAHRRRSRAASVVFGAARPMIRSITTCAIRSIPPSCRRSRRSSTTSRSTRTAQGRRHDRHRDHADRARARDRSRRITAIRSIIDDVPPLPSELDADTLPEGGMGIHIAKTMLDEVTYEPGPPNLWRLCKRLPGGARAITRV